MNSLAAKKLGGCANTDDENGNLGIAPRKCFRSILSKTAENIPLQSWIKTVLHWGGLLRYQMPTAFQN